MIMIVGFVRIFKVAGERRTRVYGKFDMNRTTALACRDIISVPSASRCVLSARGWAIVDDVYSHSVAESVLAIAHHFFRGQSIQPQGTSMGP